MNDESIQNAELSATEAEASVPAETEVTEAIDGTLIGDEIYEETGADVVYLSLEMERIGSDIVHADLFGSFLICGTLVGLALLRYIRGT